MLIGADYNSGQALQDFVSTYMHARSCYTCHCMHMRSVLVSYYLIDLKSVRDLAHVHQTVTILL